LRGLADHIDNGLNNHRGSKDAQRKTPLTINHFDGGVCNRDKFKPACAFPENVLGYHSFRPFIGLNTATVTGRLIVSRRHETRPSLSNSAGVVIVMGIGSILKKMQLVIAYDPAEIFPDPILHSSQIVVLMAWHDPRPTDPII
jgi:hypothetical protein